MSAGRSDRAPIVAVAVKYGGKVWSLPEPNRHCDIVRLISDTTGEKTIDLESEGFLDADDRYLTREQALVSALCNRQVLDENDIRHDQLFSEDLW